MSCCYIRGVASVWGKSGEASAKKTPPRNVFLSCRSFICSVDFVRLGVLVLLLLPHPSILALLGKPSRRTRRLAASVGNVALVDSKYPLPLVSLATRSK